MILALGAMILLTILILNTNKTTMATEDVMYDSNFGITATSIASSIIEDASKKRFDNIFYTMSILQEYMIQNILPLQTVWV